ncbi:MAG: M20 family metallopeptidase [Candidatus Dojkabacteria bacterium]
MDLTNILSKLVSFKTYDGNSNKAGAVEDLYKYYLNNIDQTTYKHKIVSRNGSKSLVVYSKSLKNPAIVLQSHIDVVPGKSEQFKPFKKKGKLFGRGASDMKFAAAVYLKLLDELKTQDLDIAVWLTDDEEIGGFDGVNYLLNESGFSCDFCLLPDGVNNNSIVTDAKGVQFLKITSKGKPAHGSMPWLGKNAVDNLINAYNEIKKLSILNVKKKQTWVNTLNLGLINGGEATNTVPDQASAHLDFRFVNNNAHAIFMKDVREIVKKYDLEMEDIIYGDSYSLERGNKHIKNYEKALREENVQFQYAQDHGSSDARFFNSKGIPVLMHKPICGGDHSESEWIDIESLEKYYKVILNFLSK